MHAEKTWYTVYSSAVEEKTSYLDTYDGVEKSGCLFNHRIKLEFGLNAMPWRQFRSCWSLDASKLLDLQYLLSVPVRFWKINIKPWLPGFYWIVTELILFFFFLYHLRNLDISNKSMTPEFLPKIQTIGNKFNFPNTIMDFPPRITSQFFSIDSGLRVSCFICSFLTLAIVWSYSVPRH